MLKKYLILSAMILCICSLFSTSLTVAAPPQAKTLRVGITDIAGLLQKNENGIPEGYIIDYLNEISKYTGWRYVYVEDSWTNSLKKLENNKIDMLCNAQYTPERASVFDYADYASGMEHCTLYVRSDNADIYYNDYAGFNGMKIGLIKNSYHNTSLEKYAKQNNFSYDPIYFNWTSEAFHALENHEIDAVAISSLSEELRYKPVGKFGSIPFYFVFGKGNTVLMQQLNNALDQIKCNTPTFEADLHKKYYSNYTVISQPLYTREETAYLKNSPIITIGFLPSQFPLTYYNAGVNEMQGIYETIFKLLADKSGLKFVFKPIRNTQNLTEALANGGYDVVVGNFSKDQLYRQDRLLTSSIFMDTAIATVARIGASLDHKKDRIVALTYDSYAIADYLSKTFPEYAIIYEPDLKSCLDDVNAGKADLLMHNYYSVNYLLQSPFYENLTMTTSTLKLPIYAIGAKTQDPRLFSILDKTIDKVPTEEISQIIFNHIVENTYEMDVRDFIYKNRDLLFFSSLFLFAAAMLGAYILILRRRNSTIVKERKQMLSNISNNINGGVIVCLKNNDLTITYANEGFLTLIGYAKDEFFNKKNTYISYIHPNDLEKFKIRLLETNQAGQKIEMELKIHRKDDTYVPILFRGTLACAEDGQLFIYCVIVDNTAQQKILEELKAEKERYKLIIENSDDILFDVDILNDAVTVSSQLKKTFGITLPENCTNDQFANLLTIHPDDMDKIVMIRQYIIENKAANASTQVRVRKANGSYLWCEISLSLIGGASMLHCIGKIRNIETEVAEREFLKKQIGIDQFTGLYNKSTFLDLAQDHLDSKTDSCGALAFIDIDNFKQANDLLGHLYGDQILKEIAEILKKFLRKEDLIGRFGGDEFCLLIKNVHETTAIAKMKLVGDQMHKFYENTTGNTVEISASIGIALYDSQATNLKILIQEADTALYHAKASGKNQCKVYTEDINQTTVP